MSNGIEKRNEAKFWREYDELKAEQAKQAAKAETEKPSRCKVCGEYDDDDGFPCACKA